MLIQLTDDEIAILQGAARLSPDLAAGRSQSGYADLELLLAMQLVTRREGVLQITLLGQHVLKRARNNQTPD